MTESVFDKIEKIRILIKVKFKEFNLEELYKIMDHISRIQDSSRKYLSEDELQVKDIILRARYKPKAVRYWLLATKLPRHLQLQLKEHKISYNEAIKLYREYKIRNDKSIEVQILTEIRKFVIDLQKFEYKGDENAE